MLCTLKPNGCFGFMCSFFISQMTNFILHLALSIPLSGSASFVSVHLKEPTLQFPNGSSQVALSDPATKTQL